MSDSSDPMDCSPPGSSVHGIFQAKVLEWGAIAFDWRAAIADDCDILIYQYGRKCFISHN